MRELFSTFSGVGQFDGWMIAKLNFRRLLKGSQVVSKEKYEAVVLRQRARYAILESEDDAWQIQMHLIKPREQKKEDGSREGHKKCLEKESFSGEEIARWKLDKKEILDFVNAVEDMNPIHRREHAIVPGFLFVEKLWTDAKVAEQINKWQEFQLIFSNPAYEEETITLLKEEKTGNISAVTKREKVPILLWECRKHETTQE